jgi:hypothetical protein
MSITPERRDVQEARRALDESQAKAAVTDGIIEEARAALDIVRAHRERNHYVEKFRTIIRGV